MNESYILLRKNDIITPRLRHANTASPDYETLIFKRILAIRDEYFCNKKQTHPHKQLKKKTNIFYCNCAQTHFENIYLVVKDKEKYVNIMQSTVQSKMINQP